MKAARSGAVKVLRIVAGFGLIVVGGVLAVPGVPGPGIPIMLVGLVLLSDHFDWAKRLLAWVKEKTARILRRSKDKGV
jgi:hypothetical protein